MAAYLGLGSSANTQKVIKYSGIQVSTSQLDMPVTLFWGQRRISPNLIWYNNFVAKAVSAKGKGGGGKGGQQYDYSAAVILALGEGQLDAIVNVWAGGTTTNVTTLSKLGFSFVNGSPTQAPWSFVVTKYPSQARSYLNTSYLTNPKLDLGSSPTVPDNAFECVRSNGFTNVLTAPGWKNPTTGGVTSGIDCSFADIIPDFLTFPRYGMGFTGADIGDMTQFAAYQTAQSLYFSPLLVNQEKATDIIDRWAQLSNSWIYWSGTQFQFVPLGDATITANGVTYTPDLTSAYDFDLDDYTDKDNPVKLDRVDPADCYNRTILEITDRTQGYVSNPIEYKDQTLVDEYGVRDASSTAADEICNPAVGVIVAQLVGKRAAYIRKTFTYKVPHTFIRLLPGSIVTLTEPNLGLNKFRVRVQQVEEDDNNDLTITAQELPQGIGTYNPPTATAVAGDVTTPNTNVDPGDVNTPCVFEPNSAFTGGTPKVVIAASGGVNWGGADIFISFDLGTDYTEIGSITSPAAQGVLTAALASHVDPDTVNTLSVNLAESQTTPSPVTHADADALRTLSLVVGQPSAGVIPTNGELLAFGNVATTGTYTADLTYLRRGQYGTAPAAHSIGDQFTLIDLSGLQGTTFEYNLPPQYVGQTIYLKLLSKNTFGNSRQDLSTVVEYKYTPTGAGYGGGAGGTPTEPTGLAAAPGNGQNNITWNNNPPSDNVTSYILYAAVGLSQPFGSAAPIWQGLGSAHAHSGIGNGAQYTYFLVAVNAMGNSVNTAGVNCTSNAAGIGTIAGVTAGTGLAGGGTSGVVTLALAAIAAGDLLANLTAGSAAPLPASLSAIIDYCFSAATQGDILYRNGTVWTFLPPGTAGNVLSTGGTGANPSWVAQTSLSAIADKNLLANISGGSAVPTGNSLTAILDDIFSSTQGSIIFRAATGWAALGPGTSGFMLQTNGAGADPSWAAGGGGGGGSVAIKWLGATIDSAAASLDFEGSGMTVATDGSHHVTITIVGTNLLVSGDTPGPAFITDGNGVAIAVPLQ